MLRRVQLWARRAREQAENKRDMLKEVAVTLKAAERGDVDAQNFLGWMYSQGSGVRKSKVEAIKWYRKAAQQGDSDAKQALLELEEE
mgnify:FL=1